MKLKLYCLFTGIFLFTLPSFSQGKEFNFINYTQENGLPSNESYFIYRDSKEFLWIATDKGVVRYDGNKMENFDLPDNVVFKIREDSKGRVWFFSHTGRLAYFFNGTIYPYKYNDNILKIIKNIIITDAYVDNDDNVILNSALLHNYRISRSGVIEQFDYYKSLTTDSCKITITPIGRKKLFTQIQGFVRNNDPLPFFFFLENNKQIFNYQAPLTLIDYTQYGCITINYKDFFFYSGNNIVKLMENGSFIVKKLPARVLCMNAENGSNIWVGLEKAGAVLVSSDLNELYFPEALSDKSISSVTQDYERGTWFSTLEKGVYFLKNMRVGHLNFDSSITKEVFRLHAVNDSVLMYVNQKGLYCLTNSKVTCLQKVENSRIHDLFVNDKGDVYLAGRIKRKTWENVTVKQMNHVNLVLISSSSEIVQPFKNKFVWNEGGYLASIDLRSVSMQKLFSNQSLKPIVNLFEPGIVFSDQYNQVWAGTINNLYKISSTTGVPIPFKESSSLFKKGITCMRQMDNGIYTIGIRFGGIAIMKDNGIIATITESNGLLSNSIKYLLPLKNQLWAATPKGISVIQFKSYNPLRYIITNIGKNEGFYNLIVNQLVQYSGNILAATSNGIYFIDKPMEILNEVPEPIPFYINTVNYYKGDTSNINSISVPNSRNRVSIKYSALCFNSQDEIRYYYRFDNRDTVWQLTKSTELLLENLSPGKYNLELKAEIPNRQRLSGIQKLQIIVEKPWWQNNWLRVTGIIFLLGTIFIFYKRRINIITRREQQNTDLQTKLIELEQTALRSQMNPHFIFNCLTSIQQLVVTDNKNEANEYLVRFARLIRKTLELSGRSFITIEEEIDYLNEYLILEQLRIPGQFEFSITIDQNINRQKTEIPNMMLQPIIENCIRHGIKHLDDQKGYITVSLKQEDKYIFCSIKDNGVGRAKFGKASTNSFSENKSYGMDIVNKRLEALSGHTTKESKLEIEDLYNPDGSAAGTKVTLRLPFKTR